MWGVRSENKMTLTYWCCENLMDSKVYNIRARTKREAARLRDEYGPERFGLPVKQVVEYADAFDLIESALGEGGIEQFPVDTAPPRGNREHIQARKDAWGDE